MTFFRENLSCRYAQDIKVLKVGVICTVIIFVVVSLYADSVPIEVIPTEE